VHACTLALGMLMRCLLHVGARGKASKTGKAKGMSGMGRDKSIKKPVTKR